MIWVFAAQPLQDRPQQQARIDLANGLSGRTQIQPMFNQASEAALLDLADGVIAEPAHRVLQNDRLQGKAPGKIARLDERPAAQRLYCFEHLNPGRWDALNL